jgi:hypothetical protein
VKTAAAPCSRWLLLLILAAAALGAGVRARRTCLRLARRASPPPCPSLLSPHHCALAQVPHRACARSTACLDQRILYLRVASRWWGTIWARSGAGVQGRTTPWRALPAKAAPRALPAKAGPPTPASRTSSSALTFASRCGPSSLDLFKLHSASCACVHIRTLTLSHVHALA